MCLQSFPLALWICSFFLECGDFLKEMQPFPETVDRIVANGYFAKQIVGCNLVASFKTPICLMVVIFGCTLGHHLVSVTMELGFHLPPVF